MHHNTVILPHWYSLAKHMIAEFTEPAEEVIVESPDLAAYRRYQH